MSTDTDTHATQDSAPARALERVDEAIVALDADWTFRFVNQQAADLLGREAETLLETSLWDALPEATEAAVADEFHSAMETGEPTRFDIHYDPTDARVTVRVYPGSEGVTVCFDDITRERHPEFERKRQLFEAIFEDTEDAFVIADTDRRITEFNPAAERLFGYDSEEILGRNAAILYADETDYEQQGEERFNEQADERHDSYAVEYERADGTTFEGETVGTPLEAEDGETLAFLAAIRDVSARARYERLIEARNDALRTFHDITTDRTRTYEERLEDVLKLGRDHLDLDVGILADIGGTDYTVDRMVGPPDFAEPEASSDPGETVCELVVERNALVSFASASAADTDQHPAYRKGGVGSYLGVPVVVDGECYGTLSFSSSTPRETPFAESEETFVRVLAQWIGKEISRQKDERLARANRDRLRQIVDMLPQLVFAKDESGEFLLANESLAAAYGTTVDDLEGATDDEFADSDEEAERFRADDLAVIESGEPKHIPEEPLTTANGKERTFETTKIPYDPVETEGRAVLGVATDITERKERKRELELQSAAMEASMDGIALLDADGEYVYMNQAHADVFDYDVETLLGGTWQRVYGADEIERIEEAVFPALERDGEWRGETVGKTSNGTPVHQEITLSALPDGGLICTNRDITERKERERDLERQRSRLQALFDESPDAIVIHDAAGDVLEVNNAESEQLGYDADELRSMNVAEFEAGLGRPELRELWDDMNYGEILKVNGQHRRQNGTIFPVEVWVNKVMVNGETRFIALSRDISERRKRENRLRKFEQMVKHAGHALFFTDTEGTIQYVNPAFEDLTGYTESEALGETPDLLNSGEDDGSFADRWESVLEGDVWTGEIVNERKNGERFVSSHIVAPVTDEDGTVTNFVAAYKDVTERNERERKLRESREALREITAIGSDTDRDFKAKLEAILDLGCDHLGLPYGFLNRIEGDTQHVVEATGTHSLLQPGESAPLSQAYCRETIERDEVLDVADAVDEGWADDPSYDKFELGCYIGGKVEVDGELYGTLCFADSEARSHDFDGTERAFVELLVQWISYELKGDKVERKLRQLNQTAQRLMTTTTADELASIVSESASSVLDLPLTGIWWHDEQAEALVPASAADEAAEVIGGQPTFSAGDSPAWQAFETGAVLDDDDLHAVDERYNDDTEVLSEVIVPLGDHGVLISGSTQREAISDTDRNLLQVLGSTVEEALSRAEREQDLRETRKRLEQSNQELEQFAYAASHDLQEPLRTVSSYLTLLERRYRDDLDEDAVEFIEIAVDGADRMRDMIQALLAYSRVETRGDVFEPTEMAGVFGQVARNLEVTIDESSATVDYPESTETVVGDESQLIQLFQNLVENGIKYSEGDPRVDISVERKNGVVEYAVSDTGIGIEPDQLDGIFEVFERLHTREEFDGTGIGLSLCRKIADSHGGDIRVESSPGVGSTFFVTLPEDGEPRE